MVYKIYELVTSNALTKLDNSDFSEREDRIVLTPIEWISGMERENSTYDAAAENIRQHADKFKDKTLTIIPIFDIRWDGRVRD